MISRIIIIVGTIVGTILVLSLTAGYLLGLLSGSTSSYRDIEVELANDKKIIVITIGEDAQFPYSMDLMMKGNINGKGILSYGWNDSIFYHTDTISNDFLMEFNGGEWYHDSCLIKYEPIDATQGELRIDCAIYSGKK